MCACWPNATPLQRCCQGPCSSLERAAIRRQEHSSTEAREAISAATINGAHALRRANRIGSLEHGKSADLMLLAVSDYREIPYHFGVNLVDITLRRGQVVFRRSEVDRKSV